MNNHDCIIVPDHYCKAHGREAETCPTTHAYLVTANYGNVEETIIVGIAITLEGCKKAIEAHCDGKAREIESRAYDARYRQTREGWEASTIAASRFWRRQNSDLIGPMRSPWNKRCWTYDLSGPWWTDGPITFGCELREVFR